MCSSDLIFQVTPFMPGAHRKGDAFDPGESEALGVFLGEDRPDEFDAYVRDMLAWRIDLIETHASRRPVGAARGPIGWIHGDFNPQNLLWEGSELRALIDWDRLQEAHLGSEPVRAALIFFGQDLGRIGRFLRGYRSKVGLTDDELADVVHRRWWDTLTATWQLRKHYLDADPRCDRFFVGATEQVAWLTDRYELLLAAAGNH